MSAQSPRSRSNASDFSSPTSAFASSSAKFASRSFARAISPTRLSLDGRSNTSSFQFSFKGRTTSPGRSVSVKRQIASKKITAVSTGGNQSRTCLCSPSTHPGSFRCAFHKRQQSPAANHSSNTNTLNFRRSAMVNSLVRIGGVEGDLVKRSLSALIRPSSHHHRRRATFNPKPSRLSIMSKAEDL